MPPKDSKKVKAETKKEIGKEVQETPEKKTSKLAVKKAPATPSNAASNAPTTTPKKTPSKKGVTANFTELATDGSTTAIKVQAEGVNGQALQRKANNYGQLLQLSASESFTVLKTITFTQGEYEGCQAIIIQPPKAFEFKKLSPEVRTRVYSYYFASKGCVNGPIVLDGKRPVNKEVYAKTYAEGQKNRVGLLALNKEFGKEAHDVFYSHTIRFDSTATLIDFLSQVPKPVVTRLTSIYIKNYTKTSARNAMNFLSEATNVQKLHFDAGVVSNEGNTAKAAKVIHGDMYKFLEAVGTVKGDKGAGVDVLHFGHGSLTYKDTKGAVKNWSEEMIEEFKENLKGKMK